MISRQQAYRIARRQIEHDCVIAGAVRVVRVVSGTDPGVSLGPFYHGPGDATPEECWIAYVNSDIGPGVSPSTVVMLSKDDGRVVYSGPINDEG